MANPYHDETGRFCSRGEMQSAIGRLINTGDKDAAFKLLSELKELDKDKLVISSESIKDLFTASGVGNAKQLEFFSKISDEDFVRETVTDEFIRDPKSKNALMGLMVNPDVSDEVKDKIVAGASFKFADEFQQELTTTFNKLKPEHKLALYRKIFDKGYMVKEMIYDDTISLDEKINVLNSSQLSAANKGAMFVSLGARLSHGGDNLLDDPRIKPSVDALASYLDGKSTSGSTGLTRSLIMASSTVEHATSGVASLARSTPSLATFDLLVNNKKLSNADKVQILDSSVVKLKNRWQFDEFTGGRAESSDALMNAHKKFNNLVSTRKLKQYVKQNASYFQNPKLLEEAAQVLKTEGTNSPFRVNAETVARLAQGKTSPVPVSMWMEGTQRDADAKAKENYRSWKNYVMFALIRDELTEGNS